jgi:ABC-type sulfate transport system permease subunit
MPTVIDIGEKLTTGTGVESYTLDIIAQIIYFLRILAIILAILFILYSAFNYYFSEKKQEEARKTILYSLIGAVISFFVFVIFGFIYDLIVPSFKLIL